MLPLGSCSALRLAFVSFCRFEGPESRSILIKCLLGHRTSATDVSILWPNKQLSKHSLVCPKCIHLQGNGEAVSNQGRKEALVGPQETYSSCLTALHWLHHTRGASICNSNTLDWMYLSFFLPVLLPSFSFPHYINLSQRHPALVGSCVPSALVISPLLVCIFSTNQTTLSTWKSFPELQLRERWRGGGVRCVPAAEMSAYQLETCLYQWNPMPRARMSFNDWIDFNAREFNFTWQREHKIWEPLKCCF